MPLKFEGLLFIHYSIFALQNIKIYNNFFRMKHSNNVSASKQKSKEQPPDVYKLVGANDNPAVESLLFKLTDEFSLSLRNAISAKSKIRVNVQEKVWLIIKFGNYTIASFFFSQSFWKLSTIRESIQHLAVYLKA